MGVLKVLGIAVGIGVAIGVGIGVVFTVRDAKTKHKLNKAAKSLTKNKAVAEQPA